MTTPFNVSVLSLILGLFVAAPLEAKCTSGTFRASHFTLFVDGNLVGEFAAEQRKPGTLPVFESYAPELKGKTILNWNSSCLDRLEPETGTTIGQPSYEVYTVEGRDLLPARLEHYLNNLASLEETYRSAHGRYISDISLLTSDPWSVHIPLAISAVETGWSARLQIRNIIMVCYISVGTAPRHYSGQPSGSAKCFDG